MVPAPFFVIYSCGPGVGLNGACGLVLPEGSTRQLVGVAGSGSPHVWADVKRPLLKSAAAWRISASVFITNGP